MRISPTMLRLVIGLAFSAGAVVATYATAWAMRAVPAPPPKASMPPKPSASGKVVIDLTPGPNGVWN